MNDNGQTPAILAPDSIYSPDMVSTMAVQEVEYYHNEPGLKTGYPNLDHVMNPMRPGQLIPVLGYTNNFKSGLMDGLAQNVAAQIDPEDTESIVIYVTWEDSVEQIGIKNLAAYSRLDKTALVRGELNRDEWARLRKAAVERAQKPIWLIGHTTQQYRRRQRATLPDVWGFLEYLVDVQKKKPVLIVLDYLQRIRPHGRGDRRGQMLEMVDMATDMGIAFHSPLLLGTQAGRQIMEKSRTWKLPQLHDAQETSNIEQSASAFLSVWMPVKSETLGTTLQVGDITIKVTENLLILGLLKQKDGPAPATFPYRIDFTTNKIYSIKP